MSKWQRLLPTQLREATTTVASIAAFSPTAKTEKSRGVHHAIHSTAVLLLESGNSGSRSHGLSAAQRSVRTPTQQRPRADFALLPVLSALQQLNVSSRVVSHDLKVNFSQYSRCSWSKNFPNWVRRLRKQSLTRWLRLLHSGKYFFGKRRSYTRIVVVVHS